MAAGNDRCKWQTQVSKSGKTGPKEPIFMLFECLGEGPICMETNLDESKLQMGPFTDILDTQTDFGAWVCHLRWPSRPPLLIFLL